MGGSQSLWAITGVTATGGTASPNTDPDSTGSLAGLEDLIRLETFKIDEKRMLEDSFKVHDAEGKTIFQAVPLTSSTFWSPLYKEVFRVCDSGNTDVIRVFNCLRADINDCDTSSLPGGLMGYVKIVKETHPKPEFQILDEKGETSLFVRLRVMTNEYQVFSNDVATPIGKFGPRISAGIKGKLPQDLDVKLKAGVLLSAVAVCDKSRKERKRTVILVASS